MGHRQPQAFTGIVLYLRRGIVLGFHCHGRTALGGDEHVGMAARMVWKYLGRFGEHRATRQHSADNNGQGVVGVGFGLVWHENRIEVPRFRVKHTTRVT